MRWIVFFMACVMNAVIIDQSIAQTTQPVPSFGFHAVSVSDVAKAKEEFPIKPPPGPPVGVWIYDVDPFGTFGQAGLRDHDILVRYGSTTVSNTDDLLGCKESARIGDEIDVAYKRQYGEVKGYRKWRAETKRVKILSASTPPKWIVLQEDSPENINKFYESLKKKHETILEEARLEALFANDQDREKKLDKYKLCLQPSHRPYVEFNQLSVGEIGSLSSIHVVQVIDENNMLVKPSCLFKGDFPLIWLRGMSTVETADGMTIDFKSIRYFEITGTEKYSTVIGGSKTVLRMEPLDLDRWLKSNP